MTKKISLLAIIIFLSLILFSFYHLKEKDTDNHNVKKTPNILIINIDDLGFNDLSCYGSEIYETPNIDKLRGESYTFRNAYANYPRCMPSRYALMTSMYPVKEFKSDLSKISDGNNFIKHFGNAGYQSFYIGKWHIGHGENVPVGYGFDKSFGSNGAGGVASFFYPFNTKKIIAPIGEVPPIPDVEGVGKDGDYLTDLLTDQMINFIKNRDKSKPFLAMLCTYAVHTPFEAKQKDIDRNVIQIQNYDFGNTPEYVEEGNGVTKMRQDNAVYAAMVENMDWNIGRLLDSLEGAGLKDDTILVFTSDHGGLSNRGDIERLLATTNYPLRAGKGHLYEGGIRVPLMIRWPNKIKVKEDSMNIIAQMDIMPTLLDLTINGRLTDVDGKSFKNILNETENWDDRTLFFYENMARPKFTGDFPSMAVRSGKYKLIYFLETEDYELYDLSKDISENNNIKYTFPIIAEKLKEKLLNWKKECVENN